jgi:oxygen-dependent protoporphyrinogen oxidase
MGVPEVDAVVAGAGIAGLAAALELQARGREVLVIDPADRPGGVMRTDHMAGFVVERGPNTAQVKPVMRRFLDARGLAGALQPARPASRLRHLLRGGRLVRVPSSPLAVLSTPLLSARGKLRACAEPFVRRGDGRDESVAEYVGRRAGHEVVRGLVGPFLTGVYAGDEAQLGAEAVFGSAVELERRYGSLALGSLAAALRRNKERGLPGTWSGQHGFGPLARQLAAQLAEPPALGSRVARIARDGAWWRLDVTAPGSELALRARAVVLAVPAPVAAEVLEGVDAESAAALRGVVYAPVVSAALGVEPAHARAPIRGFGFLVPREERLRLLGCLFMSQIFPGRAPEGSELLQCLLGGTRWPDAVAQPDDALLAVLREDLERALGYRGEPLVLGMARWARAIPQPGRDHAARIRFAGERLPAGLALAGSYVAGVGVADALASGLAAAASLQRS